MSANRYADLVKSVIGGSFYESKGIVIPFRYGNTEIRLETDTPNNEFGLYLNEVFSGTVISDVIGNVVFSRPLPRGEVEIQLLNSVTGRKQNSWLTVREYALWMAAYATTLELIDDNIQTVRDDMAITTVTATGVEDCFGQYVGYYNDLGLSLSAYRDTLHELRLAYRNYGGQYAGFAKAVETICQVGPLGYSRRTHGPNWVLNSSWIENDRFKERSAAVSKETNNITGVSVLSCEPDVPGGVPIGILSYDNTVNELVWAPLGVPGPAMLANNGELFLPGPPSAIPAHIAGDRVEPFSVVVATNDMIYLTIDENIGGGYIAIQLVTGLPNPTAANVAADINAALVADPRFGAPYAAFASVLFYGASNYLLVQSPVAAGSSIRIDNGLFNSAPALFGIVKGDLVAMHDLMSGVFYVSAVEGAGTIDINSGTAIIGHLYDGTTDVHSLAWASPTAPPGAFVAITDPGVYTLTDGWGAQLVVWADPDEMDVLASPWPALDTASFSFTYHRFNENLAQTQGLNVLVDASLLPAAIVWDLVDVEDDSLFQYAHPDNWTATNVRGAVIVEGSVIVDKLDPFDPSSSYAWKIDSVADNITIDGRVERVPFPQPGPRGTNSPQRGHSLVYDYENYEMTISGWLRNEMNVTTFAYVGVSFDGGLNYYYGTSTWIPRDTTGLGKPTFISGTFRIDDMTKPSPNVDQDVLIKVVVTSVNPNHSIIFEGFTAEVKYINSRSLKFGTVARSRHRQYFGELAYVWSPDILSLRQKEYLGLQYKIADKSTVYAGVEITSISSNTPAGLGTLEYSYNALGDSRLVRWNAYDLPWGFGLGWVSVISTGSYTLYASDGSYLVTTITREALPILTGSPPAVTMSKNVVISDSSVYGGLTREISPAHIALDIFDATERDALGVAKNLHGAITEADWAASELVNLTIQPADPFMYSYLYPSALPVTGELLAVNPITRKAPLLLDSDQDQHGAVLLMDSIPLPNTTVLGAANWWFNTSKEIEISAAAYSSSSVYEIDYNLLYRVTTTTFTVDPYQLDYSWFADFCMWDRRDTIEGAYLSTVPIFVNQDTGQAFLDRKSTMNKQTARLYFQDSREQREVAQRYWRFINSSTVEIDSSQVIIGAQYFLTHEESRSYEVSHLDVGLRAVPAVLDLIPGVEVTYVSGTALGPEASLECEVTFGPVYNFRLISSLGNAGTLVPVVLSGSYLIFDAVGNYLEIDVDVPSLPVVLGTYKQNMQLKQGVKFEWRCGVDVGSCLVAEWKEIEKNESVHSVDSAGVLFPIQQLRLTVGGIRDTLDFRIRSLVLKGLHLHGTPNVPGLNNVWG